MTSTITKKLIAAAALLLVASQMNLKALCAYTDGDLLLMFRRGNSGDILFNLGSVSNYLGRPNGTKIMVTNWSVFEATNFVMGPFSTNYNVSTKSFALIAATPYAAASPALWVTVGTSSQVPADIYPPRFQATWSRINGLGTAINRVEDPYYGYYISYLQNNTWVSTNVTDNSYVSSTPGETMDDYIYAMGINQVGAPVSTLGGNLPFSVENAIPGSSSFYQLNAAGDPLPAAAKIGTFSIDVYGTLVFTAGGGG